MADEQQLADQATTTLVEALVRLTEHAPGASPRRGDHGSALVLAPSPLPMFNCVCTTRHEVDAAEVGRFARVLAGRDSAWRIQLRARPGIEPPALTELTELAAELGLTAGDRTPVMVCRAGEALLPDAGSVPVRAVDGNQAQHYLTALAAGFEVPTAALEQVSAAAVLDAPGFTAYLAEHDGETVATGFGALVGDQLGVFNIATRPDQRRRGLGRAITAAVLRDGFAAGATAAHLLASPSGRPLYESMGFTTVEHWLYLAPGSGPAGARPGGVAQLHREPRCPRDHPGHRPGTSGAF